MMASSDTRMTDTSPFVTAQLHILPFDVIRATITNDLQRFDQNAPIIRSIYGAAVCRLISAMYGVFIEHLAEFGDVVPQSLKTTIVDALTLLQSRGMRIYMSFSWRSTLILHASLCGDVNTLAWVQRNLLTTTTASHPYDSVESRTTTRLLIVIDKSISIHPDSLRWFITNVSNNSGVYRKIYDYAVEVDDQEIINMIDEL